MKKTLTWILTLTWTLTLSLCFSALAEDKVTLTIGNSQSDSHPWNMAIEDMNSVWLTNIPAAAIEIINYPTPPWAQSPKCWKASKTAP